MTRALLCLAFFLASDKQLAYVDLTLPPRTAGVITGPISVSSGGGDYHHPSPQTLPVSVKLNPVSSRVEAGVAKYAVEVVVTNTGEKEIALPIGDDPNSVLAPYQTGRRYLEFTVMAEGAAAVMVGSAWAATSAGHDETIVRVGPGDSITYKVPINRAVANHVQAQSQSRELQLSVWMVPSRVETLPDGTEHHIGVGSMIRSENKTTWPAK